MNKGNPARLTWCVRAYPETDDQRKLRQQREQRPGVINPQASLPVSMVEASKRREDGYSGEERANRCSAQVRRCDLPRATWLPHRAMCTPTAGR
jgi:hypothetical protein